MKEFIKFMAIIILGAFAVIMIFVNVIAGKEENPTDNLKDMDSLKTWAQSAIIDDYCERYSHVKSIQNETKQQRELSRVENSRLQFVPQLVRNVIEDNDLPDSYTDELFYYVDAEITKCQYP